MTRRNRLSRRALLRGAGGIALALPFLEAMRPGTAAAQTVGPPRRYVVSFAGVSTGRIERIRPTATGASYTLTTPLQALEPLKAKVSVITGLRVPQSGAGGWTGNWHGSSLGPLVSGVSATGRTVANGHGDAVARGVTSDQVVADVLGVGAKRRSLEVRIQPEVYRENNDTYGIMSYRRVNSSLVAQQPYASPRLAWQALVTSFGASPSGPSVDPALEALRLQRKSVLDVVRQDREQLMTRLGSADRARMQRHFDELRELELKVAEQPTAPAPAANGQCTTVADPGPDPTRRLVDWGGSFGPAGFSGENVRGKVMCDLIHMALTCDVTRVASLMISFAQSFVAIEPLLGITGGDLHEVGHGGDASKVDRVNAWHVQQWAYLVNKLANTPEVGADGGQSVLDRTAMVLLFEGGYSSSPHSGENMLALAAGATAGERRLLQGRHLAAPSKHPVSVLLNAMAYAMNRDVASLGEVQGPIVGLTA